MAIDNSSLNSALFHYSGPHPGPKGQKVSTGLPHKQEPGKKQFLLETIDHTIFSIQQISPLIESHKELF
jgi:hypothetical protein